MFCTNCGKNIPDGSVFCPECGTTLDSAPKAPAAPAVAKKGLSKGLLIGIIAAVVAIVALVLILVLTSPKHKLIGTWSAKDEVWGQTVERKWVFKSNGKGEFKYLVDGEVQSTDKFKWKVGSKNKLTITWVDEDDDDEKETLKFSEKKAKKSDGYWYTDGNTLYLETLKLKKK